MKYLIICLMLVGCTDAEIADLKSFGDEARVTCYSGGQVIFDEQSSGKVINMSGGGWAFQSKDGRFIQTFADCFVVVK